MMTKIVIKMMMILMLMVTKAVNDSYDYDQNKSSSTTVILRLSHRTPSIISLRDWLADVATVGQ